MIRPGSDQTSVLNKGHLIAHSASYALGLDVDIDDVLFQVEAVRESLPAVLANTGLHTPPPISRMCRLRSVRRCCLWVWTLALVVRERRLDLLDLLSWNGEEIKNLLHPQLLPVSSGTLPSLSGFFSPGPRWWWDDGGDGFECFFNIVLAQYSLRYLFN